MAPAVQRTLFDFDVPDDPPMHLINVYVDGCRHTLYSVDQESGRFLAEWQHEEKHQCHGADGGAA